MPSDTKLLIQGLGTLDEEELQHALQSEVHFEVPRAPEGTLAEPATITAVISLATASFVPLSIWLSKKRRKIVRKQKFRVIRDGVIEEHELEVTATTEEELQKEIMGQLAKWAAGLHLSPPE